MSKNTPVKSSHCVIDNVQTNNNSSSPEYTVPKTNTFQIKTEKQGTITVIEHFSGNQTYLDIIKAALRRQFAE